jgi:hypothetical protein
LNVRWTPTLQRSRTVAGCHKNLGRNVTSAACGVSARNAVSGLCIAREEAAATTTVATRRS